MLDKWIGRAAIAQRTRLSPRTPHWSRRVFLGRKEVGDFGGVVGTGKQRTHDNREGEPLSLLLPRKHDECAQVVYRNAQSSRVPFG